MNLYTLSDDSLISNTKRLVSEERRVSLAVLHHPREIDRRKLFARFSCSSLYEYVTQELGYAEASAHRRIQSARLLSECPELAPRIQSGCLSLSVLSQAQAFFRKEEIRDVDQKREILKTLENQSSRQANPRVICPRESGRCRRSTLVTSLPRRNGWSGCEMGADALTGIRRLADVFRGLGSSWIT